MKDILFAFIAALVVKAIERSWKRIKEMGVSILARTAACVIVLTSVGMFVFLAFTSLGITGGGVVIVLVSVMLLLGAGREIKGQPANN